MRKTLREDVSLGAASNSVSTCCVASWESIRKELAKGDEGGGGDDHTARRSPEAGNADDVREQA